MCQHRRVFNAGIILIIADDMASYWLAGMLTLAAALIVTAMMLLNARSEEDETP